MNTFTIEKKITKNYLNTIASQLYNEFGFNPNKVKYFLLENGDFAQINSSLEGWYKIKIGIKDFLNIEIGNVLYETRFKNMIFHEFTHAKRFLEQEELVKEIKMRGLSYAYWAHLLVEEYVAYKEANLRYKPDKQFLTATEDYTIKAIRHYGHMIKFNDTGDLERDLFISYYDLATSFIIYKFGNPDFPECTLINKDIYNRFLNAFFGDLEKAIEEKYTDYYQYEVLGYKLMEDFRILFEEIGTKYITFENFKRNSCIK